MRDLTDAFWIKLKGVLFVFLGFFSAGLLLNELPSWKVAGLLVLTVWSFCRAYYFAFYVVEKYIDPQFRFSGLGSVIRYLVQKRVDR